MSMARVRPGLIQVGNLGMFQRPNKGRAELRGRKDFISEAGKGTEKQADVTEWKAGECYR